MIGAVVAVALIALAAFLVLGGDDDGGVASATTTVGSTAPTVARATTTIGSSGASTPDGAGAPTTTAATSTTTAPAGCSAPAGRCVRIDSIATDGDDFVVAYTTVGFDADLEGGPTSQHIHFFYDSVPLERAGLPAGTGEWAVWDTDQTGENVFRGDERFRPSAVPAGATALCAVPATAGHTIDPGAVPSCAELP